LTALPEGKGMGGGKTKRKKGEDLKIGAGHG